jgi:hypothetical protein
VQITQQATHPSTRFDPRFVTKTMHAYLDYPVAASLIALPFVLGLGGSNPWQNGSLSLLAWQRSF